MKDKNKKKGKEVKLVPQEELDKIEKEVIYEANENDELVAKEAEPEAPVSLGEQLDTHIAHIKDREDRTIIGYSILFRENVDSSQQEESADDGSNGIVTAPNVRHNMATSYSDIINQLILGSHTNSISNEEIGILNIIASEVAYKIINNSDKVLTEKDLADEGEGDKGMESDMDVPV